MSTFRISAIIPALNEARAISAALASCRAEGIDEVIVADGGSTDDTRPIAESAGAIVLPVSPPQRARQMNQGAAKATGDVLIFVHADTVFEPGAVAALKAWVLNPRIIGGGFRRRFRTSSRILAASCALGNARASRLGWYFGDQAIWARAEAFRQAEGFPESDIFEDLDFSRHLSRLGQTQLITPGIVTSDRRFRSGVVSRLMKDFSLTVNHLIRRGAR